jgi:hypothetical protein
MLFLFIAAASAADSINVSDTEYSNLMSSNDDSLSAENKLEISSEDSISETNIVNSHDDNLGSCSEEVLNASSDSGNNIDHILTSENTEVAHNTLGSSVSSSNSVITVVSSNDVVGADSSAKTSVKPTPVSTKLSVSDTTYAKSATCFKVTLKDKNGKALANQKVTLKVNKKTYSAFTDAKGIASIKTASLAVGTYTVSLKYAGNSNYTASSLSKKVKVLSSIVGSDLTKYHGYTSKYKVTFWKDGSPLANANVTFKIKGKTYTKTTNKNGVAKLNINLAVGKYVVTVTNPYSKEKVSHNIVVKKDKTAFKFKAKTYIVSNKKGKFTVTLKSKHGVLLKNKKVSFTYNNKTVTSKTDANGKASITIPVLAKGTYKISFRYAGNNNYYSNKNKAKIIISNPTTKVSAPVLKMKYNDGSKLKVKLTTTEGSVLANKTVKIKINGKSATSKTNSKGIAKFAIKDLNPGVYKISYTHSQKGSKDYSHGSTNVIISKSKAFLSAKDLKMKPNDGSTYNVVVKDKSGKTLKGVFVKSTIGSKSYIYQSNSKGVAKLKITRGVGYYTVKTIVADPDYKSSTLTKHITVKGKKFVAEDMYVSIGSSATYSVKLVNEKSKPVKSGNVVFTFKGKESTAKTDANGIAKIKVGVLSKGNHAIKYSYGSASGSSKIHVIDKVSVKNIIKASKTVKNYISKNSKLPSTVKIGNVKVSTAEYLYLASKAIVNLKAGKTGNIAVKNVASPTNPKTTANLGQLSDYLAVAKSVVKTSESNGKIPNSVKSKVGTIGYDGLVSAFSRVLVSYGEHKKMPSSIEVKSISSSSPTGKLNSKNTISNLAAYLAASANCEVNNDQIKELVAKLTKDCKSDKEKANAIFKYVRDTISYSFYYDTKYGAVGTLKAKTGNCVDHSHLLVAMYRTAGLAARYVHGKCTFTSGSTYGHVWTQVLIGDTWTVADATSSRNSLGNVANWNTNSYKLHGYYASISF